MPSMYDQRSANMLNGSPRAVVQSNPSVAKPSTAASTAKLIADLEKRVIASAATRSIWRKLC